MATNYPTSLDTLTNPTSTDDTVTVDHAAQHANANDAIEALETKLGTGSSTATDNTVLRGTGAGATAFGQIDIGDIASGTLSGADTTLITGTAGTSGNLGQFNADGDLVDASIASSTLITTSNFDDGATLDGDHVDIDFTPTNYTPSTTPGEAADADDLAAHLAGIDNLVAQTHRIFVPVLKTNAAGGVYDGTISTSGTYTTIASGETAFFELSVPANFSSVSSINVIMYPDTTETVQWDVDAASTAAGEAFSNSTTSNQTQAVTANQMTRVDISSDVPTIAADDILSIRISSDTTNLQIIGLEFNYNIV